MNDEATAFRVLPDPPLPGPENMARDEALLDAVGARRSPPTLRLYQWLEPTISLGYFQRYTEFEALPPPAGKLAVVRRPTGGGAILHDRELTYSLTVPIDHRLRLEGANRLYELMHDIVVMALRELGVSSTRCGVTDDSTPTRGPFFCFARRHCFDLTVGGDKIAGSAQRRTRRAVLQHGSIILENRFDQQPTARPALGYDDAIARLRRTLPMHFANLTGEVLEPGNWTAEETTSLPALIAKHLGDSWIRRM